MYAPEDYDEIEQELSKPRKPNGPTRTRLERKHRRPQHNATPTPRVNPNDKIRVIVNRLDSLRSEREQLERQLSAIQREERQLRMALVDLDAHGSH